MSAIEIGEADGDRWNLAGLLTKAGWMELSTDRLDEARLFIDRVLQLGVELDDEWQLREALLVGAVLAARQGRLPAARTMLAATRWDIEAESHQFERDRAADLATGTAVLGSRVIAVTLRVLGTLLVDDDSEAAAQGRALGVFAAAREVLERRL